MLARILVVDDEGMNRDVLSRRLAKRDYQTVTAASAYEGLAILQDQQIDLVILDVMMPGMSGMEMLSVIRQKYSSSQLPVIMATARSDSEDVVEALNRGANDYVIKPLDMPVAMARIERALKERQTAAALEKMNRDLLDSQSRSSFDDTTTSHSAEMTSKSKAKPETERAAKSVNATSAFNSDDTTDSHSRLAAESGAKLSTIGKYEIRSTLGSGGSGKVYLAHDPLIEREVAIKVLSKKYSDNHEWTHRFLNEAKATGQLDHPNIIRVYEVDVHKGSLYIVMEYAEGGNLRRWTEKKGPRCFSDVIRCVNQAAQGLHAAHAKNLIHRDVKPDNLLLTSTDQVKVSDFGIVKYQASDSDNLELTRVGKRIGTPMYMSPEQIKSKEVDCRTDVYGLGGTFFFLLVGQPPFSGSTIEEVTASHLKDPRPDPGLLNPDLPPACAEVIAKSMALDPADRYQSMDEFLQAVAALANSSAAE